MRKSAFLLVLLLLFPVVMPTFSTSIVWATEDSWVTLEPMPTARYDLGVVVVDGKIYVIGGDRSGPNPSLGNNEMYEPATDTWITKEPMPTARRNFGITVFENKIYVMGGDSSSGGPLGENEVYEPETNSWETKASLPTDRVGLCLETVDDLIYAIGGNRHGVFPVLSPLNEVYNPLTDSWTTGAYMPNFEGLGFADITSVVVDNKIYVFSCGEREGNGLFTQIYNPETDSWSSGAPIPVMIDYASAVSTSGVFAPKRIHVLGVHYDGHEGESAHQIYDPIQDTWTNGSALSLPRGSLGLATINDLLYATGGYYESIPIGNKNERYTPIGYIPEFPSWADVLTFNEAIDAISLGKTNTQSFSYSKTGDFEQSKFVSEGGITGSLVWLSTNGTYYEVEYASEKVLGKIGESYSSDWNSPNGYTFWRLSVGGGEEYWIDAFDGSIIFHLPWRGDGPSEPDPFSNLPSAIIGFITSRIGLLLLAITIAIVGAIVILVLVLNRKRKSLEVVK